MQTKLEATFRDTPQGREADRILRTCVHCGFCNATCPTYQLLGDELDGPRGRIYLIKQLLEGEPAGASTQRHLDRCLTCRACETTCPSGVEYARLLDIGRERIEATVKRPRAERFMRGLLRAVLPYPKRVRAALKLARGLSPLLPARLRDLVPDRLAAGTINGGDWPPPRHPRRVLILDGCVQAATRPQINAAAARLLDRAGLSAVRVPGSGCCGAISHHLGAAAEARTFMLNNIKAWWTEVERGAEAIITTSSACSAMLKDYGHLLAGDPEYGPKAQRISALAADATELFARLDTAPPGAAPRRRRIAFHAPCSLQHGLRAQGAAEQCLRAAGFELTPVRDPHLCCGSAGTYSVLQPELSQRLLTDKLAALQEPSPELIATANIGCLIHLQSQAKVPVRHWIEVVEEAYRSGVRSETTLTPGPSP